MLCQGTGGDHGGDDTLRTTTERRVARRSAGPRPPRGRRILVVGGGQQTFDAATDPIGNGRAMSLLFAREGARVAVADRDAASAAETVDRIRGEGGRGVAIVADITDEADVVRMVARGARGPRRSRRDGAERRHRRRRARGSRASRTTAWDTTLAVNLRGPVLCCREALPRLDDGASIVFISSIAGLTAGSQLVAYDASKAALAGLMRHVALEGSRRGIRANVVCPGLVDTPLGRLASAGRTSRAATPIPFGRQATGWEIAYAVALLHVGRERVRDRADARGRQRAHGTSSVPGSAVAPREQELRADLEGSRTWHEERERIGQPIDRVEGEGDRERVLDLLARDTGGQHRAHVVRIHRVLARQLAQHAQRRP